MEVATSVNGIADYGLSQSGVSWVPELYLRAS
jgi:hypothetical protein